MSPAFFEIGNNSSLILECVLQAMMFAAVHLNNTMICHSRMFDIDLLSLDLSTFLIIFTFNSFCGFLILRNQIIAMIKLS